jgi:hypothetical protein
LGVSRQGEFKNTIKIFWQKVRVENFFQDFDKNFDVSFSPTTFVLSHFRVFFSDGSSKTLPKTFCKKIVSKTFYKKFDQKSKTDFFSIFFYHVFGRFSVSGVQKHDKKISGKKTDPSPFLAFDPPTHHGGHRFVFNWRPLGIASFGCGIGFDLPLTAGFFTPRSLALPHLALLLPPAASQRLPAAPPKCPVPRNPNPTKQTNGLCTCVFLEAASTRHFLVTFSISTFGARRPDVPPPPLLDSHMPLCALCCGK